jgi:hypothetical protein
VVRAGSIFVNPLTTAFYLLIPVGIFIGRFCAGDTRHPWERALGILCLAGLLVTVTRSAIATLPLMLAVGILVGRRPGRAFTLVLVGTILMYPLLTSLGLGQQFSGALDPNAISTAGHLAALARDITVISAAPWGLGLAQGGAEGQRFGIGTAITAESWYLQVAVELGVLGLVAFILVLARTFQALRSQAREGNTTSVAALCALTGVAAGGTFLHSFVDLHTAYTVWALAALGVGIVVYPTAIADARAG